MILLVLLLMVFDVNGNWESILPWQAKTTLLQLSDQLNIDSIGDDPVPVYREDLDKDYIAYWYLTIKIDEYIIISSGPKTGDYKLIVQGKKPSPIDKLIQAAETKKVECKKFYVLTPTPDINLSCESNDGRIIYSKGRNVLGKNDFKALSKLWKNQKHDVENEGVWEKSFVNKHKNSTYFRALTSGSNHKIVIGDSETGRIKVMNDGIEATDEEEQNKVCRILGLCQSGDNTLIDPRKFQITKYGQLFLNLQIPHFSGNQQHFYLTLSTEDKGESEGQIFVIDAKSRVKRGTSSWQFFAIPEEELFPDYDQVGSGRKKGWLHKRTKKAGCAVGCGPVAWAMVLGYFDRRSHSKPGKYPGSQSLYKCGYDASYSSSSCVAPKNMDDRVVKLTEYLNEILGTFCLFGQGATYPKDMKKFENYFKPRQTSGNPSVTLNYKGLGAILFAVHNKGVRDWALLQIYNGWPVVVGFLSGGAFSQHYAVATKLAIREKRECKKSFWGGIKCKTTYEVEMFVHMGWGKGSSKWMVAKMFFAGVATY